MKSVRLPAAILSLLSVCSQAETQSYLGLVIGSSTFDDGGQYDSFNVDERAVTGGFYGGYRFNRYLAVDAAVKWLGTYTSEISDQRYAALTTAVMGILPLGQQSGFDLYAEGGVGAMIVNDHDFDLDSGVVDINDLSNDALSWTLLLGVGARYTLKSVPELTIRLGYEQYLFRVRQTVVEIEGDDGTGFTTYDKEIVQRIGNLAIGAQYNF